MLRVALELRLVTRSQIGREGKAKRRLEGDIVVRQVMRQSAVGVDRRGFPGLCKAKSLFSKLFCSSKRTAFPADGSRRRSQNFGQQSDE